MLQFISLCWWNRTSYLSFKSLDVCILCSFLVIGYFRWCNINLSRIWLCFAFAMQSNNEKLLENPYLQMRGILQLANDLGIDLWSSWHDFLEGYIIIRIRRSALVWEMLPLILEKNLPSFNWLRFWNMYIQIMFPSRKKIVIEFQLGWGEYKCAQRKRASGFGWAHNFDWLFW